jgi:hypothetical protein
MVINLTVYGLKINLNRRLLLKMPIIKLYQLFLGRNLLKFEDANLF